MNRFLFGITAIIFLLTCSVSTTTSYAVSLENLKSASTGDSTYKESIDAPVRKPSVLPKFETDDVSYKATQSVIYKVINIILFLAGTVAVIVIIIAGFMYVINAGDDKLQKKAKGTIINAILGLIVMFLSYTVVDNTIKYLYQKEEKQKYQEIPTLEQKDIVEQPTTVIPSATSQPKN